MLETPEIIQGNRKFFFFFYTLMVIVSLFIGAISAAKAEGIVIDTEKGETRFRTLILLTRTLINVSRRVSTSPRREHSTK
jgi:hypothetical protein